MEAPAATVRDYVILAHTRAELDQDELLATLEERLETAIVPLIVRAPDRTFEPLGGEPGPACAEMVGMRHPERVLCNVCVNADADAEDVAGNDEAAMYRFFARYRPSSLETMRDLLTYLSMYSEWAHQLYMRDYFRRNYPVLAEAMESINRMSTKALLDTSNLNLTHDHRVRGLKNPRRPKVYCSWSFLPTESEGAAVFYIPTRVPQASNVLDYLNTLFALPEDVVRAIGEAQRAASPVPVSDTVQDLLTAERTRRLTRSHSKSTKQADPRDARAARVEKNTSLQELFSTSAPRLHIFCDEPFFEPRLDYVFTPHHVYCNVFRAAVGHCDDAASSAEEDEEDLENSGTW